MAINSVDLIGRVTKEVVIRKTKNEKEFSTFTLAINEWNYQLKRVVDIYVLCVAWGKTEQKVLQEAGKQKINVIGKLATMEKTNENFKYDVMFVNVSKINYLESRGKDREYYYEGTPDVHEEAEKSGENKDVPSPNDSKSDGLTDFYDDYEDIL